MNQFTSQKLKDMTVPTVEHRHHQAQLRRVLVSRAAKQAGKKLSIQGVLQRMSKAKQIMAGAGIVGVLTVTAFTTFSQPAPVSALQVAQESSKALTQLSTQDVNTMSQQELAYHKFYPQFVEWLRLAEQAPDLKLMSYNELVQAYPHLADPQANTREPLRVIDNPRDGETPNVEILKYLEFSGVDGDARYNIVVGVNENNVPEAAMHFIVERGSPRIGG